MSVKVIDLCEPDNIVLPSKIRLLTPFLPIIVNSPALLVTVLAKLAPSTVKLMVWPATPKPNLSFRIPKIVPLPWIDVISIDVSDSVANLNVSDIVYIVTITEPSPEPCGV